MNTSIHTDKEEACKEIAGVIKTLCEKHNLKPLKLCLRNLPNWKYGGVYWNGEVELTIGI